MELVGVNTSLGGGLTGNTLSLGLVVRKGELKEKKSNGKKANELAYLTCAAEFTVFENTSLS